jgi:signal transduction histidine kinase
MPVSTSVYFGYYKMGRFVFGIALLISFQMVGLLTVVPRLLYILTVYSLMALIRIVVSEKPVGHFDFILDIIFISAMVHVSFAVYSYLTLFYLFPIFFSSLTIRNRQIFIYPVIATICYGIIFGVKGVLLTGESLFNISLHAVSFFLISIAAYNLNQRTARQERYIKSLEEERIKMLGYERLYRVSADLAHEIRNPLASISAAVQFMKEGKNSQEFVEMLGTETARLTTLVNDFLMFSRPTDAPKDKVDLSAMARVIMDRYKGDIKIAADIDDGIVIEANRVYLESALNNIVKNASEAARSAILIRVKQNSQSDVVPGEITFEVEDDGPGIDESMKERIFEPFMTTKKDGTGLGLALAFRVITSFGGNIVAGVSSSGGAKMVVVLPGDKNKERKERN